MSEASIIAIVAIIAGFLASLVTLLFTQQAEDRREVRRNEKARQLRAAELRREQYVNFLSLSIQWVRDEVFGQHVVGDDPIGRMLQTIATTKLVASPDIRALLGEYDQAMVDYADANRDNSAASAAESLRQIIHLNSRFIEVAGADLSHLGL